MARKAKDDVFRDSYTITLPDGRKLRRETSKYYGRYRDLLGRFRKVALCTDLTVSRRVLYALRESLTKVAAHVTVRPDDVPPLVRKAFVKALRESGHRCVSVEHSCRPLSAHLDDWRSVLRASGNTKKHVALVSHRAQHVIDGCKFISWSDVSASRVQAFIGDLRDSGMKSRTRNFYLRAASQFFRWAAKDGRIPENPLACLSCETVTDEDETGIFQPDELRRLIVAARTGEPWHGIGGEERALIYQVAAQCGFRAGELQKTTWDCVCLDTDAPTIIVLAKRAKNKKRFEQPLRPSTARMLACWRDSQRKFDPTARVFPNMPGSDDTADMIRFDMERAGIPLCDAAGRERNFHLLRHSFISNLASAGVAPKVAMDLARHSDINLTLRRYSHTVLAERATAVNSLPDLSPTPSVERMRATGTYAVAGSRNSGGISDKNSDEISDKTGASKSRWPASRCTNRAQLPETGLHVTPAKHGVSHTSLHLSAPHCTGEMRKPPGGLEPSTCGLQNRCSAN
jgi:integrase